MFEPTPTLCNFDFGPLFMWIGANNDQIWLPRGLKSDFEKCSNRLQLDLSSLLVNSLDVLGQILAIYDFLEAIRVILAMFEPTLTLPNFYFGQLFIWIEANNDQISLHRCEISDLEQCSNRLQLDLINYLLLLLVNVWFSASNDQIWLLEARWMAELSGREPSWYS